MEATDGTKLALLLLAFLVAEHVLWRWKPGAGDVDGRPVQSQPSRWGKHLGVVLAANLLAYLPLLTPAAVGVLAGLAVVHVLIEAAFRGGTRAILARFLAEQALQVVAVLVAWTILAPGARSVVAAWLDPARVETAAVLALAYVFVVWGGNLVVVRVLASFDLLHQGEGDERPEDARMGRALGIVERVLSLTLVLVNQWSALAILFGAKQFARAFALQPPRDADDARLALVARFSDYYFIGTSTSFLVAVATGLAARTALGG